MWLLDVFRGRLEYPELKRAIIAQARHHRATLVLIEDKGSGNSLLQDLVRDRMRNVQGVMPVADKFLRMGMQTAAIENGFVYLPTNAPWLADYLHELMMFPKGKHDDQVDSTSQALQYLNWQPKEPSITTHYRLLNERRNGSCVNITAYKKADGTWGGSSSSEPHDAIVRTKSVYGND